ncbi:hypothetical protein [Capybara microvirus Cap1_SP_64]|nr:hypothetical protein [Capybara microvirus Cap1_SP_64]
MKNSCIISRVSLVDTANLQTRYLYTFNFNNRKIADKFDVFLYRDFNLHLAHKTFDPDNSLVTIELSVPPSPQLDVFYLINEFNKNHRVKFSLK